MPESVLMAAAIDQLYAVVAEAQPCASAPNLGIAMLTTTRPRHAGAQPRRWHALETKRSAWQEAMARQLCDLVEDPGPAIAWTELCPTEAVGVAFARRAPSPLEPQTLALLHSLEPHLGRAQRVRERLELRDRALDHVSLGTIVSTTRGRPVYTNATAQRFLDDPTMSLSLHKGVLGIADDPQAHRALHRALVQVAGTTRTSLSDINLSLQGGVGAKTRYRLRVAPAGEAPWRGEGESEGTAFVLVSDLHRGLGDLSHWLRHAYQLTVMEAKVASSLGEGYSVEDTARVFGVRRSTIKSHLKHIYSKMSIGRQSELVRLLALGSGSYADAPKGPSSFRKKAPL